MSLIGSRAALQAAAGGGHLEAARLLLEKGSKIDATPGVRRGLMALQEAVRSRGLRKVELLLKKNFDVNPGPFEFGVGCLTALQAAALGGHLEVVELLLERGANVSAPPATLFLVEEQLEYL